MSHSFLTLLNRIAGVRHLIEVEQQRARPDAVRLLRLKSIVLQNVTRLRAMVAARELKVASAPRLRPLDAFKTQTLAYRLA